jgi:hypothetical protein
MAAEQGTNIIGHRQQHKGQEGRDNNTSRKAATTVSKSVHDWVFEWRYWDKTVQFECLLQLVPVASCSELKRRVTQGCVYFGNLTTRGFELLNLTFASNFIWLAFQTVVSWMLLLGKRYHPDTINCNSCKSQALDIQHYVSASPICYGF